MNPTKKYPFLGPLLSSFSQRHRKTMALVIAAIAVTGQARSFAIATTLMRWLGSRLDSAVNRFYRLLRNHRVDYTLYITAWAKQLVRRPDRHLLVAVDWTEWHHDLRMLVAAVVVGTRAVPLYAAAFEKIVRVRSQNARENAFIRVLVDGLTRAGVAATLLCDRGFRRVSWLKLLGELRIDFVVRLQDDVTVEVAGERMPLAAILLWPGQVVDLGVVALRSDASFTVRVVGCWAKGAHAPWWLATSRNDKASVVLKLYDRRMTIEEQFRDTKGRRFGAKLSWTQFRDPAALGRFVMLLAPAVLIWILVGDHASLAQPSLLLVCKKKGARQSLVTIGIRISSMDRPPDISLTARDIWRRIPAPSLRKLTTAAPGGK